MTKYLTDLDLKQRLLEECEGFIEKRLQTVKNHIAQIQESLVSETKSSAGDKHETGRALLQLEREKSGHQLSIIEKLKEDLSKINITRTSIAIGPGSVVFTTRFNYFIAISAGELMVDGTIFFAISPNTPIGLLLMGKTIDNHIKFLENSFTIINVI